MKKINWNELTPVCYSIAKHEDKDIGVAADMLAANIRAGNGVHAGSYALGPKYTPDYKALKALWDDCTDEERQSLSHDFNDWLQAMRDQYKELCEIWTDEHKSLNLRCRPTWTTCRRPWRRSSPRTWHTTTSLSIGPGESWRTRPGESWRAGPGMRF